MNFLTHQQAGVAAWMGRSNPRKFEEIAWSASGVSGAPLFEDSLGFVEGVIRVFMGAVDHFVVMGGGVALAGLGGTGAFRFLAGR